MPVDLDSLARFPERERPDDRARGDEIDALRERVRQLERARLGDAEVQPLVPARERSPAPGSRLDNVYFRQLFDNSPDGIVLLGTDDRVIDVNRGFEKLFGYSAAEVEGRPLNELIVPAGAEAEASELTASVLRGEVVNLERVRRHKDGSIVHVRLLGYPIFDDERLMGLFGIYSDISFRVRAERRLRLQGAAMNSSATAILITDADGRIEWVNPAFSRLSGYAEEEVLGESPDLLAADRESRVFDWETIRALELGDLWRGHALHRHKGGHLYTVDQTVTRLSDPANREQHFVIVQEDITARLEAEARLQHLARHDFLTDLPNRYDFNRRLVAELERAVRTGRPLAMVLLDVDQFKDINDSFGHAVGDELLIAAAARLQRTLRDHCTLARFGGDEFAILQPDIVDTGHAAELARRLVEVLSRPLDVDGREVHVTVSIGIAVCRPGQRDSRELIKKADLALYKAKSEGRSTFRFFVDGMDRRARRRMRFGQELHRAIERRELALVYQPQVDVHTDRIVAIEGLLRWTHPEHGPISPAEFVPIAEASGLVVPIGAWATRQACSQAQAWRSAHGLEIPVAVNLSPVQFTDPAFCQTVLEALDASGLPPELLELELTEGLLMRASDSVEAALKQLRQQGIRFSLDDFGKGYSSLGYLNRFSLDKLKIDRSFVREMVHREQSRVIVSAIAALGARLDVTVVAEGVETREQLEILQAEGCRHVQGYLFGQPMPPSEIDKLLADERGRLTPRGDYRP